LGSPEDMFDGEDEDEFLDALEQDFMARPGVLAKSDPLVRAARRELRWFSPLSVRSVLNSQFQSQNNSGPTAALRCAPSPDATPLRFLPPSNRDLRHWKLAPSAHARPADP
jgi:hypothetical protein